MAKSLKVAMGKDYSKYPFLNFSPDPMEGEQWKDIPGLEGCYRVSNYGRIWAEARPINSNTGAFYYTKERMRKQNLVRSYNKYTNDYSEQLGIKLRCEGASYSFKVCRLVYELFVGPLDDENGAQYVIHKDGDNCNNHFDNLMLVNGTERYVHSLTMKRVPLTGRRIEKEIVLLSPKNSPRAVVQYALDGKKIREYRSVAEAAKANETTSGYIRMVARKKHVQLNGSVYRFKDDPYHGEHAGFSIKKQVTQYTMDGRKVRTYASVKEAAASVGTDPNTLSRCALGKSLSCRNFVWRYDGDTYDGAYKDRIRNRSREIIQYSLDGEKIASFGSVNEASRMNGYSAATLLDCAHKKSKVAHGYVWRFSGDPYKGEHKDYRIGKPVTQYSRDGEKIASFSTIEAAARATGLTPDNIQKNVNGHNKTAGGFVWMCAGQTELENIPPATVVYSSNKKYGKQVVQYSPEGKKLQVFDNITDAAKVCGINGTGISAALDKDRIAGGYVWRSKGKRYKGLLAKSPPGNRPQIISQYSLEGVKLNVYGSVRDAGKAIGCSSSTISKVLAGKLKTTGGFIWQGGDGPDRIDVQLYYASTEAYVRSISKPVNKYSLKGEFLNAYPSIRAAARAEGIAAGVISSAINGQTKSAAGALWKLER
jgi:hypothetical protein